MISGFLRLRPTCYDSLWAVVGIFTGKAEKILNVSEDMLFSWTLVCILRDKAVDRSI